MLVLEQALDAEKKLGHLLVLALELVFEVWMVQKLPLVQQVLKLFLELVFVVGRL